MCCSRDISGKEKKSDEMEIKEKPHSDDLSGLKKSIAFVHTGLSNGTKPKAWE